MKILGISGSLRQGSFNTHLLRAAAPGRWVEPELAVGSTRANSGDG